jgi:hypothetical protein
MLEKDHQKQRIKSASRPVSKGVVATHARRHEDVTGPRREDNMSALEALQRLEDGGALQDLEDADLESDMAIVDNPAKAKETVKTAKGVWSPGGREILAMAAVNILAFLVILVFMLGYMSAWPFSLFLSQPPSVVDRVQGYALSDRFFGNFIYSIVLPDSFGLSALLSQSATYSGWIIGIYKGLSLFGLAFSLFLCSVRNKAWIRNIYPTIVVGKTLAFVGSLMFFLVVVYRDVIPYANSLILFSRALSGVGYGIGMIPVELIFVYTTTPAERPAMLTSAVFNVTLGIGLGPLFASVARKLYESLTGSTDGALETVMCLPLLASSVCLVAVYWVAGGEEYIKLPETTMAPTQSEIVATAGFVEQPDFWPRRIGIIACSVVVGIRAAICAGLEAATAMILERDYQWSLGTVGIAIGISFLLTVPGRVCFELLKDKVSIIDTIRLNMVGSLIASVFLFKQVEDLFTTQQGGSPLGLPFAGSVLYCAIYQVSGLIEGIMTTFALPTGSYFTVDNVILLKLIMLDSVGRTFGPPLARMIVEAGGKENGQDCYAWQQMSMTLLATLITEAVLLRSMEHIRERRRSFSLDEGHLSDMAEKPWTADTMRDPLFFPRGSTKDEKGSESDTKADDTDAQS